MNVTSESKSKGKCGVIIKREGILHTSHPLSQILQSRIEMWVDVKTINKACTLKTYLLLIVIISWWNTERAHLK